MLNLTFLVLYFCKPLLDIHHLDFTKDRLNPCIVTVVMSLCVGRYCYIQLWIQYKCAFAFEHLQSYIWKAYLFVKQRYFTIIGILHIFSLWVMSGNLSLHRNLSFRKSCSIESSRLMFKCIMITFLRHGCSSVRHTLATNYVRPLYFKLSYCSTFSMYI